MTNTTDTDTFPGVTIGSSDGSGISPAGLRDWQWVMSRDGAVVVRSGEGRYCQSRNLCAMPTVAHDDAKWCETRGAEGSMADYYENGRAGLRWWEDGAYPFSTGVKHYGIRDDSEHGRVGGRTDASVVLGLMGMR